MASSQYSPENIPVEPPPPGVTPNFVDPANRAPVFVAFTAVCLAIMWPIFLVRLYTKAWIMRNFGWDDGSSIVATALTTGLAGTYFYIMTVLGPHGWEVPVSAITPALSRALVLGSLVLYGPTIFFAKLSIFLLYLRTFGPSRTLRYWTYFGIAINLAVYAATSFTYGYLCVPRPSETWLQSQTSHRCLEEGKPLAYIQGIFGVISDLFIWILPLPVIWNLQMPFRRKVGVSVIFATGLVAVLTSILGLHYRIKQSTSKEPLWDLPSAILLSIVEPTLGVMCGCMPYLAAFWRHERSSTSFTSSVKRFFIKLTTSSRGSQSSAKLRLHTSDGAESELPGQGLHVNTNVLGSIQGNGKFMRSNAFGFDRTTQMSIISSCENVNATPRNNLE